MSRVALDSLNALLNNCVEKDNLRLDISERKSGVWGVQIYWKTNVFLNVTGIVKAVLRLISDFIESRVYHNPKLVCVTASLTLLKDSFEGRVLEKGLDDLFDELQRNYFCLFSALKIRYADGSRRVLHCGTDGSIGVYQGYSAWMTSEWKAGVCVSDSLKSTDAELKAVERLLAECPDLNKYDEINIYIDNQTVLDRLLKIKDTPFTFMSMVRERTTLEKIHLMLAIKLSGYQLTSIR